MPSPRNKVVSRRRFGVAASGLALAACLPGGGFVPNLSPSAEDHPQSSDQSIPEIEAKFENIIRKYGDRLSQEQRKKVRTVLAYHQKLLTSVRAFPLQNGDSPASVLNLVPETSSTNANDAPGSKP